MIFWCGSWSLDPYTGWRTRVWIRIRSSFHQWLSRCQQKYVFSFVFCTLFLTVGHLHQVFKKFIKKDFLLVDGRIRIRVAQKLTDPDPEHCILVRIGFISISVLTYRRYPSKIRWEEKSMPNQTIINKETCQLQTVYWTKKHAKHRLQCIKKVKRS